MQKGQLTDLERLILGAQGAAKRAAVLTLRLLAFSRRQTLDPKPAHVNQLVLGMQELIQSSIGPAIKVDVALAKEACPVVVDVSQLENALLNLCQNARDAMPHNGRIVIATKNVWIDDQTAGLNELAAGQYRCLSVTDNGTGIAPHLLSRVFDPFFTTKPVGEGTGLGLSMIYGFAQQSGGEIRLRSEVDVGTTASLYFPIHHGSGGSISGFLDEATLETVTQRKTVLVVDDEPTVRMLVVDVVEHLDCLVLEAADSEEGLRILQSDARIDLLISDVGLPGGMNGRQMADAARLARTDLRVLFITGYAANAAVGDSHLAEGMAVMTKPFSIDALSERIQSMLGTPLAAGAGT